MFIVHFTLQDIAKDETLRKECPVLNDTADESIRINRQEAKNVSTNPERSTSQGSMDQHSNMGKFK